MARSLFGRSTRSCNSLATEPKEGGSPTHAWAKYRVAFGVVEDHTRWVVRRTTVCKHKQAGRTNRFRSTHGSRVATYGRHPLGLRGGRLQRASRLKEPQALRYNTRCPTRVRTTSAIANRLTNVGGGACGCLQTASAPQGRPRRPPGPTDHPNVGSVGRHRPPWCCAPVSPVSSVCAAPR